MFSDITIPFDSVMLFNVIKLKPETKMEDVEIALGEMCNIVKNTYGNEQGGFIAGQVFRYAGFVSPEGSLNADSASSSSPPSDNQPNEHLAIVTFWRSFPQHEKSHADKIFKEKFSALAQYCYSTYELGYQLLWQGVPE